MVPHPFCPWHERAFNPFDDPHHALHHVGEALELLYISVLHVDSVALVSILRSAMSLGPLKSMIL